MIKNKNLYLVCSDDEHKRWRIGDDLVKGFKFYRDLTEAVSHAITFAKNAGCDFIIQPKNHAAHEQGGMVLGWIATPKNNSASQILLPVKT